MIDWRDPDGRLLQGLSMRAVWRWTCAAVLIVSAHVAMIWLAIHWRSAAAATGEPPPAVMIDLSPLAVASEAPPQDVAPGPQATETEPESAPRPPEPVQESEQQTEPEKSEQPVTQKLEIKPPEVPRSESAEAVVPPPPAKAEVKKKPPPKKKVERRKPREADRQAARQTSAPPSALAHRADRAVAPVAGAATSAAASASWKSELIAHLNRYKRFPSGAASSGGTATIAFTVNRAGQVVGSRLLRSSGDSVLDAEAVSLPRRASPVPAPPPGTGGASIGLSVPIRFSR